MARGRTDELDLRGGFLTGNTNSATANIDAYGVATVSGLVGLFSKQATDKLEEIFNTAFRTGSGIGDSQRNLKCQALCGSPS
jgi:hypothetical protein